MSFPKETLASSVLVTRSALQFTCGSPNTSLMLRLHPANSGNGKARASVSEHWIYQLSSIWNIIGKQPWFRLPYSQNAIPLREGIGIHDRNTYLAPTFKNVWGRYVFVGALGIPNPAGNALPSFGQHHPSSAAVWHPLLSFDTQSAFPPLPIRAFSTAWILLTPIVGS